MRLLKEFWPIVEFVLLFEKPIDNRYLKEKPASAVAPLRTVRAVAGCDAKAMFTFKFRFQI